MVRRASLETPKVSSGTRAVFATAIRARGETLRLKSSLVTVAIVCLVSLAIFSDESHTGLDDAYITYQFAENLAQGYGFVFNRTDGPVLGTSTPLYAGLLAIGAFVGADVPRFSMVLGAAGWIAVLVLVVAISWELGRLAGGVSAALMWSVTPLLVRSSEGMETSIYIALILGAILATHRSHPRTGLILAALATLTRPDGIAVFAAVTMLMLVERKWSWRVAAPGVLLLTTWLIFATYWFGNPLPTSGLAKIGHEVGISGRFSLLSPVLVSQALPAASGVRLIPYRTTIVVGLVLAMFVGALFATQKRLAAMLVWWVALYVDGYWFLKVPDFWWYYAPIAIVLGLFFWLAVAAGIAAAEQVIRSGGARFAGPIVLLESPDYRSSRPDGTEGNAVSACSRLCLGNSRLAKLCVRQ